MKCLKPQKDLTTGDVATILSALNAHVIRLEQRFLWHSFRKSPRWKRGLFHFRLGLCHGRLSVLRIAIKTKSGVLLVGRQPESESASR